MEEQVIASQAGEPVYKPQSQFSIVNPENNAIYIPDEEYAAMQQKDTPTTEEPNKEAVAQEVQTNSTTEENKPPVTFDETTWIKEKTGGKYEKWEDLDAAINKQPELKFENETSKKIVEYLKEGKYSEVESYLADKRLIEDALKPEASPEEVIKIRMAFDHPEWTIEDVEDEFEIKFRQAITEGDEKGKRRQERAIASAAIEAKQALSAHGEKIVLPELPNSEPEGYKTFKQKEQEIQDFSTKFVQSLDKNILSFKELDLSINDEDVRFEHKFKIEDNERADLLKEAQNFWQSHQNRYYKDGQYDTSKLLSDLYLRNNYAKILKSAVSKARNEAKLDNIKNIANVNTEVPSRTAVNSVDAEIQAGRAFIRG